MTWGNFDHTTFEVLKRNADEELERQREPAEAFMKIYQSGLYKALPQEMLGEVANGFCKVILDSIICQKNILGYLHQLVEKLEMRRGVHDQL